MVKTDDKIMLEPSESMGLSCRKKKYKGVRMRSWGSWVSEIRAPNQKTRIWLGSYSTAEAAARAYDAALLCLKGSSANLNFPITQSPILPDTIMSPKSIQRVAAAAANNNYENLITLTTPSSPHPPDPPSSTSPSLSPSPSSSSSDQIDEDFSIMQCWEDLLSLGAEEPTRPINPWMDFGDLSNIQSPKYVDQMFNADTFFAPPAFEEFFEEGDIRLWSFC